MRRAKAMFYVLGLFNVFWWGFTGNDGNGALGACLLALATVIGGDR